MHHCLSLSENDVLSPLLQLLLIQDGVNADTACQVGCEKAVLIDSFLDLQEISVAGVDAVELLGREDLVLGEVNLAAAPGSARADGHVVLLAVGQCLAALFDRRWTGDKGTGSDGANQ